MTYKSALLTGGKLAVGTAKPDAISEEVKIKTLNQKTPLQSFEQAVNKALGTLGVEKTSSPLIGSVVLLILLSFIYGVVK